LQRSADPTSPEANLASLLATGLDTIVGTVAWGAGPVKNVAKTPLVGGQWRLTAGGPFKYDLLITDNSGASFIPAVARMEALS
jgi:branched-chain amino acid transport system substrate-binding protein